MHGDHGGHGRGGPRQGYDEGGGYNYGGEGEYGSRGWQGGQRSYGQSGGYGEGGFNPEGAKAGYRGYGAEPGYAPAQWQHGRGMHGGRPDRRDFGHTGQGAYGGRAEGGYAGRDQTGGRVGHYGRGPRNYTRSDDRIREDVNDRLTDDPEIDATEVEVTVSNCEVTLSGTVQSRDEKRAAEDCAESVSGVKHVQNNLRVQQIGTASEVNWSAGGAKRESSGSTGSSGSQASGRSKS